MPLKLDYPHYVLFHFRFSLRCVSAQSLNVGWGEVYVTTRDGGNADNARLHGRRR